MDNRQPQLWFEPDGAVVDAETGEVLGHLAEEVPDPAEGEDLRNLRSKSGTDETSSERP